MARRPWPLAEAREALVVDVGDLDWRWGASARRRALTLVEGDGTQVARDERIMELQGQRQGGHKG